MQTTSFPRRIVLSSVAFLAVGANSNSGFVSMTQAQYSSVSQPPGRSPVPGPGTNYTGPREVLLEFVILVF